MIDVKHLREQLIFAVYHVSHGDLGKMHARLPGTVRRRGRDSIAERIDQNHVVLRGVNHLAWPNVRQPLLGFSPCPGGNHDDVRLIGIHVPGCAVSETAIVQDFATLELEVAEIAELLFLGKDQRGR